MHPTQTKILEILDENAVRDNIWMTTNQITELLEQADIKLHWQTVHRALSGLIESRYVVFKIEGSNRIYTRKDTKVSAPTKIYWQLNVI